MLEMRIDGYLCTRNAEGVNRMIFPYSYYPLSYSQEARYTSHECKTSQGLAFTTQRKLLQISSKKACNNFCHACVKTREHCSNSLQRLFVSSKRRYCEHLPSKQADLLVRAPSPALTSSIIPLKCPSQAYTINRCINNMGVFRTFEL